MNQKAGVNWVRDGKVIRKVWRYDDNTIAEYSRDGVEQELLALFPTLKSKGLRIEISYEDSLVGIVLIDSNADLQAALTAFAEESNLTYRTLFVEECVKPEVEVQCSKMQKEKSPPKKSERLATATKYHNGVRKWILLPAAPLCELFLTFLDC